MKDNYKHKGMRLNLVYQLEAQGIQAEKVLAAISKVPRHFFFEKAFLEKAYENKAFPIGANQTISQPYTVAYQSELLQVKKGQKILEVGTGSGYQACILAELGARVVTIERHRSLHQKAKQLLKAMGYIPPIVCLFDDGYNGAPSYGPFDRILITAAAPYIPPVLLEQLTIGGIMVVPVGGQERGQQMLQITKVGETEFVQKEKGMFRFVPMLKGRKG